MRRTVTKVIDGDTFIVNRMINGTNKIRLANVNAPEKNQFGGKSATSTLRNLISGETVTIVPVGRSYDRIVANVRVDRSLVNKRMKERGY
ncbi:MAG: thermonuclease family protein [Candidatus Woesearchaeota archaeon]|nr:thermonuclease family protein [Candidatus Woesearchaeota archaeon]